MHKRYSAREIEPISANEGCTRLWKPEIQFDGSMEGLGVQPQQLDTATIGMHVPRSVKRTDSSRGSIIKENKMFRRRRLFAGGRHFETFTT